MMKNKTVILITCVFLFSMAIQAFASSLITEIQWMDNLPGVTLQNRAAKEGNATALYNVTKTGPEFLSAIRAELKKKGWNIVKDTDVNTAGVKVNTLKATRKNLNLEIVIKDSYVNRIMDVTVKSAAGGTGTEKASESKAIEASAMQTINDNNVTAVYKCSNTNFTINGDSNHITLTGSVSQLSLNGSDNNITIKASVGSISIMGSNNKVSWSKAKNPNSPSILNLGSDNQVKKTP